MTRGGLFRIARGVAHDAGEPGLARTVAGYVLLQIAKETDEREGVDARLAAIGDAELRRRARLTLQHLTDPALDRGPAWAVFGELCEVDPKAWRRARGFLRGNAWAMLGKPGERLYPKVVDSSESQLGMVAV